jgi:dolichol-phosphate mannosyltransferase
MTPVRTLVALATYNEIENLPSLVGAIVRILPDADVLVVDDNSPDGTGKWCDEQSKVESRLHCIHRPGKLGLGSATIAAMRYTIEHQYDVLITLDADWSHDPKHLMELLAALHHADVAIGSRYCSGGEIKDWPMRRRVMSRWVNRLTRFLLRLPVHDASGAYRAFRVVKLRELRIDDIQATGYAFLEEVLWHLHRAGATFAEVPITFRDRRAGTSKVSFGEAWGKLRTILRLAKPP